MTNYHRKRTQHILLLETQKWESNHPAALARSRLFYYFCWSPLRWLKSALLLLLQKVPLSCCKYPFDWFTVCHMFQPKETDKSGLLMSYATQSEMQVFPNENKIKNNKEGDVNVKTVTSDDTSCKTTYGVASHLLWESCWRVHACVSVCVFVHKCPIKSV